MSTSVEILQEIIEDLARREDWQRVNELEKIRDHLADLEQRQNETSQKHDGWCVRNQRWNNYLDATSFRLTRSRCIQDFISGTRWNWRQFKARGWQCVKVRVVPVEEQS